MNDEAEFRTVVAIDAEAAPIREKFGLKDAGLGGLYPVFRNQKGNHWLVVSGVGKVNGGAGVAHLSQVSHAPPWAAWINVGIAGHPKGPLGRVYLAHQIIEESTSKRYYPSLVFDSPVPTAVLTTVDKPELDYPRDGLYDMEASGVFDIARRLSAQALVQTLKVVSDTRDQPVRRFSGAEIKGWIDEAVDPLCGVMEELAVLSAAEASRLAEPKHLEPALATHHFTVSQRRQLQSLLRRWTVLNPNESPILILKSARHAKAAIMSLRDTLDNMPIHWSAQ